MATLLLADHAAGRLTDDTARALTAALQLGLPVEVLVVGHGVGAVAEAAAVLEGVAKVLCADDSRYAHLLAEPTATLIAARARDYDALVAAATSSGKDILPRVAASLDVMQVSDIIKVVAPDTFERPTYAGNAIQTVRATDALKAITVRTASFAATPARQGAPAPIVAIEPAADPGLSRFVGEVVSASDRPPLTSAKIVVSGGRALQSRENFLRYVEGLADRLGAAVGASRAAVDAGYAPNDWQVGQTGKAVAPDLYIAIGISGAIQHLAGIKDSKVIVAINKDEEAPIFQVADYGLVGDLFRILPELETELAKLGR